MLTKHIGIVVKFSTTLASAEPPGNGSRDLFLLQGSERINQFQLLNDGNGYIDLNYDNWNSELHTYIIRKLNIKYQRYTD